MPTLPPIAPTPELDAAVRRRHDEAATARAGARGSQADPGPMFREPHRVPERGGRVMVWDIMRVPERWSFCTSGASAEVATSDAFAAHRYDGVSPPGAGG